MMEDKELIFSLKSGIVYWFFRVQSLSQELGECLIYRCYQLNSEYEYPNNILQARTWPNWYSNQGPLARGVGAVKYKYCKPA
jgi:hypothetical protein